MSRTGPLSSGQGRKRLLVSCLLVALSGFIIALWFGLPLHPLVNQVEQFAARQSLQLDISQPGRAFPFGLQADKIRVGHRQLSREPLTLADVDIRPLWSSLFGGNPGLDIAARLFAGKLKAETHSNGEILLELTNLQLRESLGPQVPLEAAGTLTQGTFEGQLPLAGQNQSKMQLKLDNAVLLGLEKLGGSQDRMPLGSIQVKAESRGQVLQIRQLEALGGAVELAGSGSLNIGANPANSRLALSIILKPTDRLDPGFRDLLSLLGKPGRDGAYRFRLSGPLNAIQMR